MECLFSSLCMKRSLIWDAWSLLDVWFANIFSSFMACLFTFLRVFLNAQVLILGKPPHVFSFIVCAFGVLRKKSLLDPCCKDVVLCLLLTFASSCLSGCVHLIQAISVVGKQLSVAFPSDLNLCSTLALVPPLPFLILSSFVSPPHPQ